MSESILEAKRIWLKAFWGFDPTEDGYLGFTLVSDRDRLVAEWQRGDLVLIYGADAKVTAQESRRQALVNEPFTSSTELTAPAAGTCAEVPLMAR